MPPEGHYADRHIDALDAAGIPARRPLFPAIRWGAVLAGVAVGISVQLVLSLLGVASGLSMAEFGPGPSSAIGPLLWAGMSMLVAGFVGGYVAARMSGLKRRSDGVLHGAVSWAVTTILLAVVATSAGGMMFSGVLGNLGQLAGGVSSAPDTPVTAVLRSQAGHLDPALQARLRQAIEAGRRDEAVRLLAEAGMDPARAGILVDQIMIIAASPLAGMQNGESRPRAAAAAWIVFGAVALALAAGIGGGARGAAASRRVTWTAGTRLP
jgi:hypothetical protein